MSVLIIICVLLLFLAGIVALMEHKFGSIKAGLKRERLQSEEDVKRRTFIANCLSSRRRFR